MNSKQLSVSNQKSTSQKTKLATDYYNLTVIYLKNRYEIILVPKRILASVYKLRYFRKIYSLEKSTIDFALR